MPDDQIERLAAQAYVYGFPIVVNLDQVNRYVTTGVGAVAAAPFNTFSHARVLAGPDDTFVSINNDTLYTMAQLDLGVGPLLLEVPDTGGRYYVLQFVDAWTNNFAYIGHRATGTSAGRFLLVPHDWSGTAGDDMTVVRVPTRIATIVGRWACEGPDDLPAVHALQDATRITPLDPESVPTGIPAPDPAVPDHLLFLEKLRLWSQEFPPAARDRSLQAAFAPLGTGAAGRSPYRADLGDRDAPLRAGLAAGEAELDRLLTAGGGSAPVNGWLLTLHVFDYNLDYFEVGAMEDPDFMITDPAARIAARAVAAKAGLWGNHAYEAAYIMTFEDEDGDQLVGSQEYRLRLTPPPPVGAFWSLTMYELLPDFYLVANEIGRYSIGDRTPDVVRDEDGGVTITISHARPADPTAARNWLPAPPGPFRPILRMYEPAAAVLDQSYVVPAITKA